MGDSADAFVRTANRHDYGLLPTGPTAVDFLQQAGFDTIAVGKTYDLLCGHGFDRSYHNQSNSDGMDHVDEVMSQDWCGLCFTNLVDFDPSTAIAAILWATAWPLRTSTAALAA